jgi:hypothetical protein
MLLLRHSNSLPTVDGGFLLQGSSRTLRNSRPPAGLQLLWTWSSSTTGARPVTGMAWNCCNKGLLAAGYGRSPAPGQAAGPAEANAEAVRPGSVEPAGAYRTSGSGSLEEGAEDAGGLPGSWPPVPVTVTGERMCACQLWHFAQPAKTDATDWQLLTIVSKSHVPARTATADTSLSYCKQSC